MKQKTQQKPAAEISKWCTKLNKPTESTQKMISELLNSKEIGFPNRVT